MFSIPTVLEFEMPRGFNGADKWGRSIKLSPLSVAISVSTIICGMWN